MKKIISLALAASMVAGMAVTAFAEPADLHKDLIVANNPVRTIDGKDVVLPEQRFYDYNKYTGKVTIDLETNGLSDREVLRNKAYVDVQFGGDKVNVKDLKIEKIQVKDPTVKYVMSDKINNIYKKDIYRMEKLPRTQANMYIDANKVDVLGMSSADVPNYNNYSVELLFTYNTEPAAKPKASELNFEKSQLDLNKNNLSFAIAIVPENDEWGYKIIDPFAEIKDAKGNVIKAKATTTGEARKIEEMKSFILNNIKAQNDRKIPNTPDRITEKWVMSFVLENTKTTQEDIVLRATVAPNEGVKRDNLNDKKYGSDRYVVVKEALAPLSAPKGYTEYLCNQGVEEFYFDHIDQTAKFVVDTTGMTKFNVDLSSNVNEEVYAKYADTTYNLYFYNFKGEPTFKRHGDLTFTCESVNFKGYHVYEIDADNNLTEVPAKFDENTNGLVIKTRQLKNYVLADADLLAVEEPTEAPSEETETPSEEVEKPAQKPNVPTGR